jgi:3-deoxy-manno-octulosonate cytidylyltransferase (CMP-KDO synthetase)
MTIGIVVQQDNQCNFKSYIKMKVIAIIPSRIGSTRLPEKALRKINGKPMIQVVYEKVSEVIKEVYVATDSLKIRNVIEEAGGNAILTPIICNSGSDRCAIAYDILRKRNPNAQPADWIINVQGDEPLIHRIHLESLLTSFRESPGIHLHTLACRMLRSEAEEYQMGNTTYVTTSANRTAMYFSRFLIPYGSVTVHKHLGIYGFSVGGLKAYNNLEPPIIEHVEKLEQLRWLHSGGTIKVQFVDRPTLGVDTEDDLKEAERLLVLRDWRDNLTTK